MAFGSGQGMVQIGQGGAAVFALLYQACLLLDLLDSGDFFYLVVMVTLPFSLVAFAAADALQAPLGLSFETLNLVAWAFLGVFGLVEFYVIATCLIKAFWHCCTGTVQRRRKLSKARRFATSC
ncbi:hypothetical protein [Stenotrophomonas sp. Ste96]|jgi:hypothetical protein|uniref:hypothetical protein n=1 Tax=Stenotrophomonas sp. Ste96 TaxID=2926029 RepID=UPI0021C613B8|nr:hypothetical protein [Stenotrophomonas sp. Ste96]